MIEDCLGNPLHPGDFFMNSYKNEWDPDLRLYILLDYTKNGNIRAARLHGKIHIQATLRPDILTVKVHPDLVPEPVHSELLGIYETRRFLNAKFKRDGK